MPGINSARLQLLVTSVSGAWLTFWSSARAETWVSGGGYGASLSNERGAAMLTITPGMPPADGDLLARDRTRPDVRIDERELSQMWRKKGLSKEEDCWLRVVLPFFGQDALLARLLEEGASNRR